MKKTIAVIFLVMCTSFNLQAVERAEDINALLKNWYQLWDNLYDRPSVKIEDKLATLVAKDKLNLNFGRISIESRDRFHQALVGLKNKKAKTIHSFHNFNRLDSGGIVAYVRYRKLYPEKVDANVEITIGFTRENGELKISKYEPKIIKK
ncbi:MAG: hypothetical protein HOE90_19800 [Bacteriovoracaceae bacterium]|jgi:hypothetical protein|nr:hypothetical protein [Bacteriovoracaceae bacterium]